IGGRAADHGSEAGVDVEQVGASEVVNREGVDSTQRVEVEVLDVVEVQGHRADVAGEADAGAVGRDVEDFADVGAIEDHAVIAVLAFDRVVTVARVPLEGVVTGTEEHGIVALIAIDEVVVVAAEQNIGSVAAQDGVITGSAIDGDLNQRGEVPSRGKGVIAAVGVEHQALAGAEAEGERSRVDAIETHAGAVGGGGELFGAIAAVDFNRVDTGAALIKVGIVAGIPDHAIVARFAEDLVVGIAAGQCIAVRAAEEEVESAFAKQRVVAEAAEKEVVA